MQNFKTFLTEDVANTVLLQISLAFKQISQREFDIIAKALHMLPISGLTFDIEETHIIVNIKVKPDIVKSSKVKPNPKLIKLIETIFDTVDDKTAALTDGSRDTPQLIIHEIPDYIFYFSDVLLIVPNTKISISNISKYLNCEKFKIYKSNVIEGGVLELLKINAKKLFISPYAKGVWVDTINKYFNSKDIISCQSELIEAGFKEFAKL
jgi:hypothetical protein